MIQQVGKGKRAKYFKPIKYYSVRDFLKEKKLLKEKDLYNKIFDELFLSVRELFLKNEKIELKYLGEFYFTRFKSRKKVVDFGLTKKYNKTIYYTNFHTQRMTYKIIWKHGHLRRLFYFES